jgi:hypothetical protein
MKNEQTAMSALREGDEGDEMNLSSLSLRVPTNPTTPAISSATRASLSLPQQYNTHQPRKPSHFYILFRYTFPDFRVIV